jgi:hypothetical protein
MARSLKAKFTWRGEVPCAATRSTAPRMHDIEVIDSELHLLLAIRQMVSLIEGTHHADSASQRPVPAAAQSGCHR